MATIKAIEAKSVHQIQSGQVIVDLCSVVKELVENSLDAGATTIEVRFKNNGLDSIEVHDNGSGISPDNYANVALKHFTSKLSSYDDLSTLETFGFRGEALSSLCALAHFYVTTAQASEAPKGTRLEFDALGGLKSTSTLACQRGTTAIVEDIFSPLPVRRKELTKNIKREYGKVLGLLHAYACIGVNVKFTVKNTMPKGKSQVIFSTKGNATTRDNIANVYGAKTLSALVALELDLDFQPTLTQMARKDTNVKSVMVCGHISRPVSGEGRQTPDRQMFFVNGRPCGLPQIAKAINEVYKSYNVSQSPFIFADFRMDTQAYDVNVSPDKRTILLHNAASLIERLKLCLNELFDKQDQTVPQSQFQTPKLPAFRQLPVQRLTEVTSNDDGNTHSTTTSSRSRLQDDERSLDEEDSDGDEPRRLMHDHFRDQASTREEKDEKREGKLKARAEKDRERRAAKAAEAVAKQKETGEGLDEYVDLREVQAPIFDASQDEEQSATDKNAAIRVRDFNARMAEVQQRNQPSNEETEAVEQPVSTSTPVTTKEAPGIVQNTFDRMRPKRTQAQIATITIGDETTTTVIGTELPKPVVGKGAPKAGPRESNKHPALTQFSQRLARFGAESQARPTEAANVFVGERPSGDTLAAEDGLSIDEEEDEGLDGTHNRPEPAGTGSDIDETNDDASDSDYADEKEKKAEEDVRVAELIRAAEESANKVNNRRANKALKPGMLKDTTTDLLAITDVSLEELKAQLSSLITVQKSHEQASTDKPATDLGAADAESRLSLTVAKADFADMEIVGQFNLGFILAVRRGSDEYGSVPTEDELFIIDQHASDEKFNFERLQAETTVGNQRMVKPVTLDLTAVEEEIVLENTVALEKNGFILDIDTTGVQPVGRRCTLLSLPLSKEVVFDTRDLDELIHLLSEAPMLGVESSVPRPSRVRKMFAMRACRSSIMIGKTLSKKQMQRVVTNMGTIDKPWNCPHGRPTMRHLSNLDGVETWNEGDGVAIEELGAGTAMYGVNSSSDRREKWHSFMADHD